ncbi:hypothetical protein [Actinacidiphila oryziradicis]|uniref:Uncharacterized protein n=1 Tax=Actinacidiphila oryziradicis TaxID=2571141 RepID=A0A4U0REE6_9ACTN|nr:hypothetical protein [Actinacidiphila oryziradicis]TJZ93665.1 hypothetical protein FCI23_54205 [Actinacidiphila oryziradicis]
MNATAEQAAATLPQRVADAWAAQWDEHCAGRTGRDREAEGRRRLATLTRTAVDRCRGKHEHLLTTKPTALDRRLCDRLARDLDTLRGTVPDLLGASLVLPQDSDP